MTYESSEEHGSTALWRQLLDTQTDLFRNTVAENESLTARNRELEREVSVWKHALSKADAEQEEVQRTAGNYKQQVSDLQQQLRAVQEDSPLIPALIDGDGNIFSEDLLRQGSQGGRNAAILLTKGILEHVNSLNPRISSRARVWASVFCNKQGLSETLSANNAAPLFSIIDVGHGKEAADTKLKEYLRVFSRYPQTAYIYFGGGHDNGYYASLASMETEGLLDKVVLLHGYKELALELKGIKLQALQIEGLFRDTKVVSHAASKHKSKRSIQDASPKKSEDKLNGTHNAGKKRMEPGVSIFKYRPTPCTFYYLGNCNKATKCAYGHNYDLLPEHVDEMKKNSKKFPCPIVNKGKLCPLGENCISSHHCPYGRTCFYRKQGKCRYLGADMHSKTRENNNKSPMSPASSIYRSTPTLVPLDIDDSDEDIITFP